MNMNNDLSTARIDRLRWVTLILQILAGSITAYVYLVSIYIGPLVETYGWSAQTIILEFTLMTAVGIPANIIGGKLRDKYGSKWCLKVGGIGFAVSTVLSALPFNVWFYVIGQGVFATFFMYVVYVSALANVGELFPDKRGFALGIAIGAIGVISALLSPIAELLIRTTGPSMSIVLQGIVYGLVTFICGFFIIVPPEGYKPQGWEEEELEKLDGVGDEVASPRMNEPWQKIIKTPAFWLVGIALGIGLLLIMGFASDVSLLAQNLFGVDSKQGAFVYMIYALTTGVGGFLIGGAADKIGPMRAWMITSAITAVFVFALVLSGLSSYVFFVIVVAWVGIAGGASTTLMPTVLMPAFGVKTFGVNFGLFGIVMVTASLLGSQMSVSMDTSKFLIIGAIGSLAAIVLSLVAVKAVNKYHGFKVLK